MTFTNYRKLARRCNDGCINSRLTGSVVDRPVLRRQAGPRPGVDRNRLIAVWAGRPDSIFSFACLALLLVMGIPQFSKGGPPNPIRLDLPETIELNVLVDYVARARSINVLYDAAQLRQTVTLRTHAQVDAEQLVPLLRQLLRSRQLALVEGAAGGWYEIVPFERLAHVSAPTRREEELPSVDANEVITLRIAAAQMPAGVALETLSGVLTKPGGRIERTADGDCLITDFASNVRIALEGIRKVRPPEALEWQLIATRQAAPQRLVSLLTPLLSPPTAPGAVVAPGAGVELRLDPLGRGLLIRGSAGTVQSAKALVAEFDVAEQIEAQIYQPKHIDAARLQELASSLLGIEKSRTLVDASRNTLWLETTPILHHRLRELMHQTDTPVEFAAKPLRIYKLLNRRADDMFATLGGLMGNPTGGGSSNPPNSDAVAARRTPERAQAGNSGLSTASIEGNARSGSSATSSGGASGSAAASIAIQGDGYSLALDEHTNSIIAVATPAIHEQIKSLIESLDRRRPQVLVEVTLVSISVEDSLNLGVELSTADLGDPWDFLLFTSFGMSTIDTTTGGRRVTVMPGGSGILLAPDEVPLIVNALQTRGNTRVFSAPKILVDDNATGRIESVAESPFTSVNASDTVATTAFAGFAKAGTQLSIEPHIAEGDHLELKYDLTVSSFTGAGSAAVPPPRSSDTISSTVRVPDGHTVVVGGLLSETLAEAVSQLPLVGDVPILGALLGNRSNSKSKVRLYAFIRPSILRATEFEDLKYLSGKDLKRAEVSDGLPPPQYQLMR